MFGFHGEDGEEKMTEVQPKNNIIDRYTYIPVYVAGP
jgi:hypothetical protein